MSPISCRRYLSSSLFQLLLDCLRPGMAFFMCITRLESIPRNLWSPGGSSTYTVSTSIGALRKADVCGVDFPIFQCCDEDEDSQGNHKASRRRCLGVTSCWRKPFGQTRYLYLLTPPLSFSLIAKTDREGIARWPWGMAERGISSNTSRSKYCCHSLWMARLKLSILC